MQLAGKDKNLSPTLARIATDDYTKGLISQSMKLRVDPPVDPKALLIPRTPVDRKLTRNFAVEAMANAIVSNKNFSLKLSVDHVQRILNIPGALESMELWVAEELTDAENGRTLDRAVADARKHFDLAVKQERHLKGIADRFAKARVQFLIDPGSLDEAELGVYQATLQLSLSQGPLIYNDRQSLFDQDTGSMEPEPVQSLVQAAGGPDPLTAQYSLPDVSRWQEGFAYVAIPVGTYNPRSFGLVADAKKDDWVLVPTKSVDKVCAGFEFRAQGDIRATFLFQCSLANPDMLCADSFVATFNAVHATFEGHRRALQKAKKLFPKYTFKGNFYPTPPKATAPVLDGEFKPSDFYGPAASPSTFFEEDVLQVHRDKQAIRVPQIGGAKKMHPAVLLQDYRGQSVLDKASLPVSGLSLDHLERLLQKPAEQDDLGTWLVSFFSTKLIGESRAEKYDKVRPLRTAHATYSAKSQSPAQASLLEGVNFLLGQRVLLSMADLVSWLSLFNYDTSARTAAKLLKGGFDLAIYNLGPVLSRLFPENRVKTKMLKLQAKALGNLELVSILNNDAHLAAYLTKHLRGRHGLLELTFSDLQHSVHLPQTHYVPVMSDGGSLFLQEGNGKFRCISEMLNKDADDKSSPFQRRYRCTFAARLLVATYGSLDCSNQKMAEVVASQNTLLEDLFRHAGPRESDVKKFERFLDGKAPPAPPKNDVAMEELDQQKQAVFQMRCSKGLKCRQKEQASDSSVDMFLSKAFKKYDNWHQAHSKEEFKEYFESNFHETAPAQDILWQLKDNLFCGPGMTPLQRKIKLRWLLDHRGTEYPQFAQADKQGATGFDCLMLSAMLKAHAHIHPYGAGAFVFTPPGSISGRKINIIERPNGSFFVQSLKPLVGVQMNQNSQVPVESMELVRSRFPLPLLGFETKQQLAYALQEAKKVFAKNYFFTPNSSPTPENVVGALGEFKEPQLARYFPTLILFLRERFQDNKDAIQLNVDKFLLMAYLCETGSPGVPKAFKKSTVRKIRDQFDTVYKRSIACKQEKEQKRTASGGHEGGTSREDTLQEETKEQTRDDQQSGGLPKSIDGVSDWATFPWYALLDRLFEASQNQAGAESFARGFLAGSVVESAPQAVIDLDGGEKIAKQGETAPETKDQEKKEQQKATGENALEEGGKDTVGASGEGTPDAENSGLASTV